MKFVNIPVFLVSLAFGLFYVYIMIPPMKEIHVFPTPDNLNDLQYKDNTDMCFQFEPQQVKCPIDRSKIKNYTIQ